MINNQTQVIPSVNDPYLKIAIRRLNLLEKPLLVRIIPEPGALNGFCSENVLRKIAADRGELICGWQFYHTPYWLEAEFHAIWKSTSGALIDITPSEMDLDVNLFVPDPIRTFDGTYRDNLRINSTNNPLVDGLILVEEAIFKIQDQFYDTNGVRLTKIPEKAMLKYEALTDMSNILRGMIAYKSESSPCFCSSGISYNRCCGSDLHSRLNIFLST